MAAYNKTKAPFNWTATADSILEKIQKLCSQISRHTSSRSHGASVLNNTGGVQMKTLTLRIPDVEAAMLVEVQKSNKSFRDPQGLLLGLIWQEYSKTAAGRAAKIRPAADEQPNVPLITPPAAGTFLSHHPQVIAEHF